MAISFKYKFLNPICPPDFISSEPETRKIGFPISYTVLITERLGLSSKMLKIVIFAGLIGVWGQVPGVSFPSNVCNRGKLTPDT